MARCLTVLKGQSSDHRAFDRCCREAHIPDTVIVTATAMIRGAMITTEGVDALVFVARDTHSDGCSEEAELAHRSAEARVNP